jgi:hypothetical protein
MRAAALQGPGLARALPAVVPLHPRPRRAGFGGHHHHRGAPLRSDLLLLQQPTAVPLRARSPPSSSTSSNVVGIAGTYFALTLCSENPSSDSGVWVLFSCSRRTPTQGKAPTSCSTICSRSTAKSCTAPAGPGPWQTRPTKTPSACHVCPCVLLELSSADCGSPYLSFFQWRFLWLKLPAR